MNEKFYQCPDCKGVLTSQDFENEKDKIAKGEKTTGNCKHCGIEFTEGKEFAELVKCPKHGIFYRTIENCSECKKINNKKPIGTTEEEQKKYAIEYECPSCKKTTPEAEFKGSCKNCGHKGGLFNKLTFEGNSNPNNSYRQEILKIIEDASQKKQIRGVKWKHCGNTFSKMEEFVEHFRNCSNVPNPTNSTTGIGFCKKCGVLDFLSIQGQGNIIEEHECKSLRDKNNNCLICKKQLDENYPNWTEHQECIEKISQKIGFGLKLERTKNNPKMLIALSSGIVLIVIGTVGIIIALMKLKQLNKQNLEHEAS